MDKFPATLLNRKILKHTHTHTHTHKRTKQRCRELCNKKGVPLVQIRLGPLCANSGNTGPSAIDKTPGAGPSTHRSTEYAPPLWCGHLKSHMYPSGIRHNQWSCPSPAYARFQIYYFTWDWVGCQVVKERCVFFSLSSGNWWNWNLSSFD